MVSVGRPVEGSITFPNLTQHNVTVIHFHKFERFMIQFKNKVLSQLSFLKLRLTCTGQHRC